MKKTKKQLKKGVDFIFSNQQPNGNFLGLTSINPGNFNDAEKKNTIFITCLILSNLNKLNDSLLAYKQKKKIVDFLLKQRSSNWSFNYWEREGGGSKKDSRSDDLGVTFCALSALYEFDPDIFDEEAVMSAVALLTFLEESEGGPYRTWIIGGDIQKEQGDIDLAVNSNIAYFLSFQDIYLDSIVSLVEDAISSGKFESPYYSSSYSVLYFISRCYKGKDREKIIEFILRKRKKDFTWGNALDTSLACGALINLGASLKDVEPSIKKLTLLQGKDGSWSAAPFVVEKIRKDAVYHSGSKELTTSFCLGVISDFLKESNNEKEEGSSRQVRTKEAQEIYEKILSKIEKIINNLEGEIKQSANDQIKKTLQSEEIIDELALLPFYFRKALKEKGVNINNEIVVGLGVVSVLGWAAYDLYDDLIDSEGDPQNISLANVFLRELCAVYFEVIRDNVALMEFFRETMNRVESANFWEINNCRIEVNEGKLVFDKDIFDGFDPEILFNRSAGHFLGVGTLVLMDGKKKNSKDFVNIFSFFRHYIIARQLNDDMHDWEDDISKGHVNKVVLMVIQKTQKRKAIYVEDDLQEMREVFWNDIVVEICKEIDFHVSEARECLNRIGMGGEGCFFEKLICQFEKISEKTLKERGEAIEILKFYSDKK